MNDAIYREANALVRALLTTGPAANLLTTFSRVWLRHARFVALLRKMRFDGVIDGGANVGEFTNLVRDVLPQADLVAVEPHPGNANVLRRQGHRVVEAALWHKTGTLTLTQPTSASTSCTVMPADATSGTWQVEGIRLEDVPVSGRRLLVKLDLQGAEPRALEGMGSLWDWCAAFVIEVSFGENGTSDAIARTMRERGFVEYATLNELETSGLVTEADKVWVSGELLETFRSATSDPAPPPQRSNWLGHLEFNLRPLPGYGLLEPILERAALRDWARTHRPPAPRSIKTAAIRRFADPTRRVFVETGTFYGDMVAALRDDFARLYSIELSAGLYRKAMRRFEGDPGITILHGDSGSVLGPVLRGADAPAVLWLDGHYSGVLTARSKDGDTPVMQELRTALESGTEDDAILIDDARLFGQGRGYRSLMEVEALLLRFRPGWSMKVEDDIIQLAKIRKTSTPK